MLKTFLIILIIIFWGGGIFAFFTTPQNTSMPFHNYILFPVGLLVNIICAKYLYSKAQDKKTEWALFGLLGNINALLIFWFWTFCLNRWRQGKRVFGD